MRLVIQRVKNAKVEVENKVTGQINKGLLVLLGIGPNDTLEDIDYFLNKLINLRIFNDENDKMNLSIKDISGEILIVSQFTLYADCKKGNRPSFINAASPEKANNLYECFVQKAKQTGINIQTGIFGAHMEVSLLNDGPVTIILEN